MPSLSWLARRYLPVALSVGKALEKSCAPGTRSWPGSRVSLGAAVRSARYSGAVGTLLHNGGEKAIAMKGSRAFAIRACI